MWLSLRLAVWIYKVISHQNENLTAKLEEIGLQVFMEVILLKLGSSETILDTFIQITALVGVLQGSYFLELPLILLWCVVSPYQNFDKISTAQLQAALNGSRDNVKTRIMQLPFDPNDSMFGFFKGLSEAVKSMIESPNLALYGEKHI